jgi:hypothetical protein
MDAMDDTTTHAAATTSTTPTSTIDQMSRPIRRDVVLSSVKKQKCTHLTNTEVANRSKIESSSNIQGKGSSYEVSGGDKIQSGGSFPGQREGDTLHVLHDFPQEKYGNILSSTIAVTKNKASSVLTSDLAAQDMSYRQHSIHGVISITDPLSVVTDDDREYATTYLYKLMAQMQKCVATDADCSKNGGRCKTGFPGLACRYCLGVNGTRAGRYFPLTFKTFANPNSTTYWMNDHMLKCHMNELDVKNLEALHNSRASGRDDLEVVRYETTFFQRIWNRLHPDQPIYDGIDSEVAEANTGTSIPGGSIIDPLVVVIDDDRQYGTAFLYKLMAQMQRCVAAEADCNGMRRCKPGFPGLVCRHCYSGAHGKGQGRYFPSTFQAFATLNRTAYLMYQHLIKCHKDEIDVKDLVAIYKSRASCQEDLEKGDVTTFFRRIWNRLHPDQPADNGVGSTFVQADTSTSIHGVSITDPASVVTDDDRQYATTFLYKLMAQMQQCVATEADWGRHGRHSTPGFPGLACRHCLGLNATRAGRYFPFTFKTFTSPSCTTHCMYDHLIKCHMNELNVKDLVALYQSLTDGRDNMEVNDEITFFRQIWNRLHPDQSNDL